MAPILFDKSDTNAPVAHATQRGANSVVAALTHFTSKTFVLCKLRALELRMPIRAYLDRNHRFDGETLRLMGIAFEMALASHRAAAPGGGDPVREALAKQIIAVAKAGVRDPERLCEAAMKAVDPPDPLLGSPPPAEFPEGGQAAEG